MAIRIVSEPFQPFDGQFYFAGRDVFLLGQPVAEQGDVFPNKSVQQTIVHVANFSAQLVNAVAKHVSARASQLTAELLQQIDQVQAFIERSPIALLLFCNSASHWSTGIVPSSSWYSKTSVSGMARPRRVV